MIVCDVGTSTVRRSKPKMGRSSTEKKEQKILCTTVVPVSSADIRFEVLKALTAEVFGYVTLRSPYM